MEEGGGGGVSHLVKHLYGLRRRATSNKGAKTSLLSGTESLLSRILSRGTLQTVCQTA